MKHLRFLPIFLVAACGGGISSHEDAAEAQIDVMNDMTAALKSIKDKKSAEAAKSKLEALAKRQKEIQAEAAKLKGPPDPVAMQKYSSKMMEATMKLAEAMQGVPADPEVQQVLNGIDMGH